MIYLELLLHIGRTTVGIQMTLTNLGFERTLVNCQDMGSLFPENSTKLYYQEKLLKELVRVASIGRELSLQPRLLTFNFLRTIQPIKK